MLVANKHCEGCIYFKHTGNSNTIKNPNKKTGFCPFIRCVKRNGFKTNHRRFLNNDKVE